MIPEFTFHDGHAIPSLGFGTSQIKRADTILEALRAGYRLIDTAAFYGNEREVGQAVREARLPRAEIFITSKVWPDHFGRDATRKSFDRSLMLLGMDAVELFLLHWPGSSDRARLDAWRVLVELKREGRARSIGVSNHSADQVSALADATGIMPVLNQVELHPLKPQRELRAFHTSHNIVTESWSPLGRGRMLREPLFAEIGRAHGRSPAQILLRWQVQHGLLPIPKASSFARMKENLALYDFELSPADMAKIDALDG